MTPGAEQRSAHTSGSHLIKGAFWGIRAACQRSPAEPCTKPVCLSFPFPSASPRAKGEGPWTPQGPQPRPRTDGAGSREWGRALRSPPPCGSLPYLRCLLPIPAPNPPCPAPIHHASPIPRGHGEQDFTSPLQAQGREHKNRPVWPRGAAETSSEGLVCQPQPLAHPPPGPHPLLPPTGDLSQAGFAPVGPGAARGTPRERSPSGTMPCLGDCCLSGQGRQDKDTRARG